MKNLSLITDRLVLRDFVDFDWKAIHDYASDPEVVHYMEWGPNTEKDTRNFVRRAIASQQEQPPRNYQFAIVLKTENQLIGAIDIRFSDPGNQEGSIGYTLNRRYWGKGYATEAARALLTFGFSKLKLHRIFATCDPANIGSICVLEKIGMQREGHLRQHKWQKGRWRDSFLYAIIDHEWKRLKAGKADQVSP